MQRPSYSLMSDPLANPQFRRGWAHPRPQGCEAAWNKDPVFGVIGIPMGTGVRPVHSGFPGDMGAGSGMLVVETIAKIRRAYFAQKKPIKAICREFRLSRKVVRKVIRSEATEVHYGRGRQPLPRIDPWRDQLDQLLLGNENKPARERLTLIRIFEELRGPGYEGSYDAVRRYAKKWRVERGAATAEAYVPLSFAPGEAYQFDWSHEVVLINGTTSR